MVAKDLTREQEVRNLNRLKKTNAADLKKALNRKYQNKLGNKAQVPEGECDEDFDHDYDNLKATCDVSVFENSLLKQVWKKN